MTSGTRRQTATERREQVLAAAIEEFAEHGYHAAKTGSIAKRARISQPYIYALFENKLVLFLAVQDLVSERIIKGFTAAWNVAVASEEDRNERLRALGESHRTLMAADKNLLRCRFQGYAAVGEPEIRDHMRTMYLKDFDALRTLTGYDDATLVGFLATGALLNIGYVLDLPTELVFAPPHR
jgi:AcrR family transcriptional regulator